MPNFQKLHYFCVMVEEGGIHKAALRLGLSQPPLSIALRELEKELGTSLVFRSGHNWIVTDAGRRLYEKGRNILAMTDSLAETVALSNAPPHGLVNCGFSTSCVSAFLRIQEHVAQKYREIRIQVKFSDSANLSRDVSQRLIEFALIYLPADGSKFDITPLPAQRLGVLLSPLLPPLPDREIALEEICGLPLLLPKRWKGGGIATIFSREIQRLGLQPHIMCQSQSTYVLRSLLQTVPAALILPECEALQANHTNCCFRLIRELQPALVPAIITLKNTFLPNPALKLISIVEELFPAGRHDCKIP